ncbi:MAG: hypothetical protein Q8R30_00350 [bacterium]|nr:hypothetical protein [bacterium]MDZ4286045.1 hypothetical protein [Candidatus Sungbacteria bacterium]
MAKKQLLYAAFDTGPSNYGLDIVAYAQRKKNWGVAYFGNNPTVNLDMPWNLEFDYAIVGGPSSFENGLDKEILSYCYDHSKSVFVLGDSPRSILRPGVKEYVGDATAIVASPADVEPAKEFGYKDAVWLEGYPSHWGADPEKVKPSDIFTRGDYPMAGIKVFVCGLKHAEITDNMLAATLAAVSQTGQNCHIYFQAHPSEIEATKNAERRAGLLDHWYVSELKTRENVASIMTAASLTVCTGGATAIVEGALLRLPVIYYVDDLVKPYNQKQSNEEIPGSVMSGACELATQETMGHVVRSLLFGGSMRVALSAKQAAAFPQQAPGLNICQEVLDYIENPEGYVFFSKRQK